MASAADVDWRRQPYRIQAILAVDAPGEISDCLVAALPLHLAERAAAAVGPLWELDAQIAGGRVRQRILCELDALTDDPAAEFSFDSDKLVLLSVRATSEGYDMAGREFDRYLGRWGATVRRSTRQWDAIGEQLFSLLHRVVAPLAQLEVDSESVRSVKIVLRGAELPQMARDARGIRPGDVFLPVLRRTSRSGELLPKGIQVIPWTYVETIDVREDGTVAGRVHSASRRPLIARRGRVEQIGMALRGDPDETVLHLVSRAKSSESLAGYSVYSQNTGDEKQELVGLSNAAGRISISPGATAVQTIFIKHGDSLLARFPIVPGIEPQLAVPVLNDDTRLAAETRLAALREELIDVVARRNILVARTRRKIEAGEFKEAQQLLSTLDQLPGRAQFSQELTREQRLHQSPDIRVQKRIDQAVKGTEAVVTKYLDSQPIRQLHDELRAAQTNKK